MDNVLEKTALKVDEFVNKQKTFIEKKLLEAELHNSTNPTLYSAEEIKDKLKNRYGI